MKMDSDYFDSALTSLSKTQHKRRLLQILIVIRKATTGPHKVARISKLHSTGSLKYIVGCLQSESCSIVDATLSILGNCCCISDNCAKDVMRKYEILPALSALLEKHDQDSIKGRTFRLIGNLSDHWLCGSIVVKEPAVVNTIVNFLKKVSSTEEATKDYYLEMSEATINMAIRALRKLLTKLTVDILISTHQVLKCVGWVLLKFTPLWEMSKQYKLVLNDTLGLLLAYSGHKHADSITELKNTGNGDALTCLSNLVLLYPTRVIKIVMNFSIYLSLKSDLPVISICEKLMEGLKDLQNSEDSNLYKEYLQALCKLVDNPAHREKVRNAEVIPMLIEILKSMNTPSRTCLEYCSLILTTFIKCKYDEATIAIQLRCGIVPIFVNKLEWIYGSSSLINTSHVSKKRKSTFSSVKYKRFRKDITRGSACFSTSEMFNLAPYEIDDDLPLKIERSSSPSSSSDISSNPNSPNYPIDVDEELSDSDNYSPICSDNEETEYVSTPNQIEEFTISDQDDLVRMVKDYPCDKLFLKTTIKDEIHTLLRWYIKFRPIAMELANAQLLIGLMNGALDLTYPFNTSFDLVLNILSIQDYLIPLMQTSFIPMVYDLTITDHGDNCWDCFQLSEKGVHVLSKFTILAESACGKGEIAHQLLRANSDVKEKLVLVIPFIIRSKVILSKLMLNCGGLNILMRLIQETPELQTQSIKSLCALALHQLKIKSPVNLFAKKIKLEFDACEYKVAENCDNVVTFKLDDGTRIKADRDFLSEKSDYFNCLLSGDFRESHEQEIVLHNVASKSLQCLLNLLQREVTKFGLLELNLDLEVLLDVIVLADRYILLEIAVYLTGCVEQIYLSSGSVPVIYQWSIESGTNILRVETIAFALVGDILDAERVLMFRHLFSLGLSEHLVEDIQQLLIRFLK